MHICFDAHITRKFYVSNDVFNAPFEISLLYMWW